MIWKILEPTNYVNASLKHELNQEISNNHSYYFQQLYKLKILDKIKNLFYR